MVSVVQDEFWKGFLPKTSVTLSEPAVNALQGKRVLVTGAGGYIGSALVHALAGFNTDRLILLESNEHGLYSLDQALRQSKEIAPCVRILGSVCDRTLLHDLFERHRPQIIFHTAALKHVPLLELNPLAAVETNVFGTSNLIELASQCDAEQMIHLSTDKAVDPINIMGASKRIAELILLSYRIGVQANVETKIVRLCNVLGSSGSVAPLFLQQLEAGLPLTITSREATRYFISLGEAESLLLSAATRPFPTGLSVPDVNKPRKILDLASFLLTHMRKGVFSESGIIFTGLRPGDKLHERLTSMRERTFRHSEGDRLIDVESRTFNGEVLFESMKKLRHAIDQRNLTALIETVCLLVPEYMPSKVVLASTKVDA